MKRTILSALMAGGLGVGAAAAHEAVLVYDANLGEEFETKRAIVELSEEIYGETAVYDTGTDLPEYLMKEITPGYVASDAIAFTDVPEPLKGRLPHTEPGTTWMSLGDHLVELKPDRTVVMTIYDVLP